MSNKMNTSKRVAIRFAYALEGQLRKVYGEDGELIVFDTAIGAETTDGKRYILSGFLIPGAVRNPEGFNVPNYNYANDAERMCERIERVGSIDLQYWHEEAPAPTWAEREAYNLKCEADERAWGIN